MANESLDPVGGEPEEQHCSQLFKIVKNEEIVMQGLVTTELQVGSMVSCRFNSICPKTNTWLM